MIEFAFQTDAESYPYCIQIMNEMMRLFGISEHEAVGRINRYWAGKALLGHDCPIYHESPEYFAKTVYYGPGVPWWKGEKNLAPSPYP